MLPSFSKHEKKRLAAIEKVKLIHRKFPDIAIIDEQIESIGQNLDEYDNNKLQKLINQREQLLKKHNLPLDIDKPDYDCAYCEDTGYIEIVDQEASKEYSY